MHRMRGIWPWCSLSCHGPVAGKGNPFLFHPGSREPSSSEQGTASNHQTENGKPSIAGNQVVTRTPLQLQTSDLAPHTYTLLTRRRPQGGYAAESARDYMI